MSMEHTEKITCPACGHTQDFTIWLSLNADLDPDAKLRLMGGSLFDFECGRCGHRTNVNYNILYHDMTNRVMVNYVDEASVEKALAQMEEAERMYGGAMAGYRRRIVTDQNALREKAIIFDMGLDDRVIEIIKLFLLSNAREQAPDANIEMMYFRTEDGRYVMDFIGDRILSAEVPAHLYEEIRNNFADRLDAAGDRDVFIGPGWALDFLQ